MLKGFPNRTCCSARLTASYAVFHDILSHEIRCPYAALALHESMTLKNKVFSTDYACEPTLLVTRRSKTLIANRMPSSSLRIH